METRGFLLQNPLQALGKWTKPLPPDWFGSPVPRPVKNVPVRMISIVIPAHNEEAYLERTLEALQQQNYRWFEVIVVANGCTDRTAEVARGKCHRLIVLSQKNLGVARNLGARMARGDLLLFLDADTTLEPMALRRIAQDFGECDAAGTLRGRAGGERLCFHLIYALKNALHRFSLHPGSSGVILCWKQHFIQAGGFDEGLEIRENSELMKRLRRFGRYKYIGDVAATTSMRRFEQEGISRVAWLWIRVFIQSIVGDLHERRYEAVR
jgi:glycosyltransferase involved in cell wall biosynthesis